LPEKCTTILPPSRKEYDSLVLFIVKHSNYLKVKFVKKILIFITTNRYNLQIHFMTNPMTIIWYHYIILFGTNLEAVCVGVLI